MKRVLILCLLLLIQLHPVLFGAKKEKPPEYQTKGVFISRIAMFIQWPEGSPVKNKSRPIVLGVIGENPFLEKQKGEDAPKNWIEDIYVQQEHKIKSKPVEVRYVSDIDEIRECNILFISKSEKKVLPEILAAARENNVLTFSDTDGFAKKGVHFNFVLKSGTVRYEINETTMLEAGLDFKYHLLKYATRRVSPVKKR